MDEYANNLATIYKTYGPQNQLIKLYEETQELLNAINRVPLNMVDVFEEFADVCVVMAQFANDSDANEFINAAREYKAAREVARIKSGIKWNTQN